MKPVLHDQELEAFERLLQHTEVRKGNDGVSRDNPERAYALVERRLDDVRIRQASRRRHPFDGNVPERRQFLAVSRVLELSIAGHARREARLTRSHRIALAGDGEGGGALTADVSGDQRQVIDGGDGLSALRAVIHAHRPGDEAALGIGVEPRRSVDQLRSETGNFGNTLWAVVANGLAQLVETGRVAVNVLAVDQVMR